MPAGVRAAPGVELLVNHNRWWSWLTALAPASAAGIGASTLAVLDQVIASAANFLTGVIIGRTCSQEEFGLYLLGFSVIMVPQLFQTSLVSSPYMVYSPRLRGHDHELYTGSTLVHQFVISLVASMGLAITSVILAAGVGPDGLASVVRALMMVTPLILLREYARRTCFANLQFRTAVALDGCAGVLQLGALAVLAYRGQATAASTYWIIGLTSGVAAAYWLVRGRKAFSVSVHDVVTSGRRNWAMGRWILASLLLWESNNILYPWLLAAFHGTASTGTWAACFGVFALANPLMLGMQNVVGPQIAHSYARGGTVRLRHFVSKVSASFSLLILPIALTILIFNDRLIVLFYGDKYEGNGLIVIPLAIELLIAPSRYAVSRALVVLERSDLDFATNLLSLLVFLSMGISLTRVWGPLGVSCAMLAGSAAVTVTKYLAFSTIIRRDRPQAMS